MFSYKKAKNVLALTAALSVLCSQSVFAATLELDLEETIQRALLTNPSVKIAEYNRKAAKADYSAAKGARGISISLSHDSGRGGYADYAMRSVNGGTEILTKGIGNSHSNSITASLPIFTGGELQGQIGQAKANYRSMLSAEEQAYNEMKETATTGYFNMLNATNMKALRQESVDRLQAHLDNVIAQYNVGIVARADVLRSEVELANAKQDYITASNEYDVAEATLNNIIGTPLNTTLKLKDSLQYVPYDNDMAYCLAYSEQHRPELKQAEYAIDSAEAALVVARSGHMPKVYANASNNWGGNGSDWPGDDDENWSVGVTASMNVFDSGVTWSKIHAAQENLAKAKESQRQIKDNVELEVRTDYLNLREAEKRITTTQVAVASAEEDYHIAVVRYQAGVGTNIDVMDAQEALTQAKTNYYQALYNYNTSKAALNTSMGVGVPVPEPRTFPEPVEDTAAQAAESQSAGTDAAAQTENAADGSEQAPANTADAEQPAAENAASTAAENVSTAAAEQTAE
ncbi:TolC family protein [Phascolarctobacterium faecium]|nr:TolC family protein [Phascolarctobacterium faecium]MDM8110819.1 TolC family protein [Phascolarctobacterium faecium]